VIDVIIIGDYKTGTSWWQQQILNTNDQIYYLDDPKKHKEIIRLMHELIDSRDLDFDAHKYRADFKDKITRLNLGNKKTVICREALSGIYPTGENAKRTCMRLREVFGESKIILMIREQKSMLLAMYSEYIKIGGTVDFEEFIFDPIISPGMLEKLKYHKIVAIYNEFFGENNVFVGLFEEFKSNNSLFLEKIALFIGVNKGINIPQNNVVINPSLTLYGIQVQRFLNRFLRNDVNLRKPFLPIDRIVTMFISKDRKNKIIEQTKLRLIYSKSGGDKYVLRYAVNCFLTTKIAQLCTQIRIGPKVSIPKKLSASLEAEFYESNRVLIDKYQLPLREYGWCL
jgi:hypothetical protein